MSTSETRFPNGDHLNPFPNGVVPEPIRFLNAFEMYKDEIIPTKKDAAVVAEMKVSTFKHRTCGRRSAAEYGKSRRLLLDEEEEVLIWRCEILQRGGFPQSIGDVTAIAEEILRKHEPAATVSPRWVQRSLHQRRPDVRIRWSQQLNRIRARHTNNYNALELFWQNVSLLLHMLVKAKHGMILARGNCQGVRSKTSQYLRCRRDRIRNGKHTVPTCTRYHTTSTDFGRSTFPGRSQGTTASTWCTYPRRFP